tara:strand:- start:2027 stop:3778 length:1752 start_codon:yes stop_codon:yes gene_type:complete
MKHALLPTLLLATTSIAVADEVSLMFRGSTGYVAIVRVDAADGTTRSVPEDLRGIQLLDLDVVGRTTVSCLEPDCAQRVAGPSGSARLELPSGIALHHFRRAGTQGTTFGFLIVADGREPRVIHEQDGVGPTRDQDPFLSHVAIDPGGWSVLVATSLVAGGDLLEIDLRAAVVHERTRNLEPILFTRSGMGLADDWGWAASRRGVLRFGRKQGDRAQFAPIVGSPLPSFWSGEAAPSRNQAFVITTAGSGPDQLSPWIFGKSGPLIAASAYVGPIGPAGYLPMQEGGPYMAISDDGRLSGWRQDAVTQEGYCCRTLVPGPLHTVEVTADAYMLDTLDAVGIVGFFDPTRLTIAVGEREGPGIDKFDLYGLSIDDLGALDYTNTTQSSLDATVPFLSVPGLSPDGLTWIPEAQQFVVYDDGAETLVRSPLNPGGTQTMLTNVKDLDEVSASGDRVLLNLRRTNGGQVHELYSVASDLTGNLTPILTGIDGVEYRNPTSDGLGRTLIVQTHELGGEQVWLLDLTTGQSTALLPSLATTVGTLRFDDGNRVLVETFDAGNAATTRAFDVSGPTPVLAWSRTLELMP